MWRQSSNVAYYNLKTFPSGVSYQSESNSQKAFLDIFTIAALKMGKRYLLILNKSEMSLSNLQKDIFKYLIKIYTFSRCTMQVQLAGKCFAPTYCKQVLFYRFLWYGTSCQFFSFLLPKLNFQTLVLTFQALPNLPAPQFIYLAKRGLVNQ